MCNIFLHHMKQKKQATGQEKNDAWLLHTVFPGCQRNRGLLVNSQCLLSLLSLMFVVLFSTEELKVINHVFIASGNKLRLGCGVCSG